MYAGKFNLNNWLRTFVREDLVDQYEENCLRVVNKYTGEKTSEVIIDFCNELNEQLLKMFKKGLEEDLK